MPDQSPDVGEMVNHPMVTLFLRDPWSLLKWVNRTLDFGEACPIDEQSPPEVDADRQMIRDLVTIEKELRCPEPARYVVENVERLRAEAIANAHKMRNAALANSSKSDESALMPVADDGVRQDSHTERLLAVVEQQNAMLKQLIGKSVSVAPLNSNPPPDAAASTGAPEATATKPIPLFSEAAEKYLIDRIAANGEVETADIKSVRRRVEVFIALVGDKRLDCYEHDDFQKFVNELQFWPPKPETHKELRNKKIKEIIALNKEHGHKFGILGRKTLEEHYLSEMRTILDKGVIIAKIDHPIPKFKLTISSIFKETQKRVAPAMSRMTEAFRLAIEAEQFAVAILLLLGMLTGRRLGLLVYLRGSHFEKVHGYTVVKVPQHITDPATGRKIEVPIKTRESLSGFILNRLFDDCGFSAFAISLGDAFLFPAWHSCKDPADAAQKAVNGFLEQAETGGTFHGFRHWFITLVRRSGVSDYANRVQVGHAGIDEHETYGGLPMGPEDADKLKNLTLPEEVDFELFKGKDFARLWAGSGT